MLGRREQGGKKAILVGRAHQRLAIGERVLHGPVILYAAAMRPAATRRPSAISTL